jgi:hypothetical protein
MVPVHRLSDALRDVAAKHLELVRDAIVRSRELLKFPPPDSFVGRKTQEPFPSADAAPRCWPNIEGGPKAGASK